MTSYTAKSTANASKKVFYTKPVSREVTQSNILRGMLELMRTSPKPAATNTHPSSD